MTIEHTEYWEMKCDRCGRYLYNPKNDDIRFFRFQEMLDYAESKGWHCMIPFMHLCSQCKIERDIELNEKPPIEV